jgi:hypothetical protein
MKPTYISRPIHTIDAPFPEKPDLKFVYNFFVADERVNDKAPSISKPIGALTTQELRLKVPRYVIINWKKTRFDKQRTRDIESNREFFSSNEKIIYDETSILSDMTLLYFQDLDHKNRVGERFEASARLRGILSGSSTDIAAKLNAITSDDTDGDLIQRYVSLAAQGRSLFINGDALIEPVDASAAEQLTMIIDQDYTLKASRQSGTSPVASSAAGVKQNSESMRVSSIGRKNKLPLESEMELELESVSDFKSGPRSNVGTVEHLGYVVERFAVSNNDRVVQKRRFFIASPKITSYIDVEIQYGVQYLYSVRNLAAFYVNTVRDNGEVLTSRFLVASRPSTFSNVMTSEYIPPPPPSDLNFLWDYQRASLQINWAFPSNPQRDIKGWQLFRRRGLDEPFSLISQIDFDDSIIRTPSAENVDPSLIKRYESPVTFFIDPEFDKDSEYIYAVCSIDAHAMTSNYSMQYRVSFNRIQNRLIKTLISQSGAAKQYPNTYLKAELSLDSVRSSNIENIRVYFDPEYLKVTDNDGRDLKVLKTDTRSGVYRISLLSTDRQTQANVDISVKDLTTLKLDNPAS